MKHNKIKSVLLKIQNLWILKSIMNVFQFNRVQKVMLLITPQLEDLQVNQISRITCFHLEIFYTRVVHLAQDLKQLQKKLNSKYIQLLLLLKNKNRHR
jgi:hypothetical protein